MLKQAKIWVGLWFILLLIWGLFVAALSWQEVLIGVGITTLATWSWHIVYINSAIKFAPKLYWLLQCWRVPGLILHDCWLVIRHLYRQRCLGKDHAGIFQALRFPGGTDDAQSVARRVLAITYLTLSPNSLVIDIDQRTGLLLLHQLKKRLRHHSSSNWEQHEHLARHRKYAAGLSTTMRYSLPPW